MKTRQYTVKVCEVTLTNNEQFISFFNAQYELFKEHLISINGEVDAELESYLNEKGFKFIVNVELPRGKSKRAVEEIIQEQQVQHNIDRHKIEQELSKLSNRLQNNLSVKDTLIRSGQELKIDGDLLLLNRVNSGGRIDINGNLSNNQVVEGGIRCSGNFMMLKASTKANVVFHDVEVDNSLLQDRLSRVELIDNEIVITAVLKETNWVSQ
ncbi:MAG: hypothetical protein U9N42_00540 [Campylobacterota bacterium]|nr:hypothetical protein [Campylobacterota bacterium]